MSNLVENITNTILALFESVATKMPFLSENARNKTPLQDSIHVYLDIKATEFNLHHFYTFTSVHLLKKISWRLRESMVKVKRTRKIELTRANEILKMLCSLFRDSDESSESDVTYGICRHEN